MNDDLISRSAMLDDLRGSYNDLKNIYDKLHYPDEKEICKAELATFMEVILRVKDAHAVDAVEVVKCRDCYYWMKAKVNRSGGLVCPKSGMEIVATDFCSRAEKRKCHYDR